MKKIILIFFILLTTITYSQIWENIDSGTDYVLFDMSIPPGQSDIIYAAGMQYTWDAEGIIIKSIDGGDTWSQIVGGANTPGFEAICFTSTEVGYVAGWDGYFAKTIDGGQTWQTISAGFDNWFFMDIEFFNENNGAALANLNSGASGVYITDNAGESWVAATGINQNIQDLAYANESTVWAVGADEKISKSSDGGLSFSQVYAGTPSRFFIGCDFDKNYGVIGGEDGKIFSTADGGNTWNTFATGYENFQGIHVFENDSAYVGGTDENIYKSLNWGDNWEIEEDGSGFSHIYKVKFTSDGTGFLCGSQGMIKRKAAPLIAGFDADQTDICDGNEVAFTDMSSGAIESWSWTFEGGYPSDSQEPNPIIFYLDAGSYDVSLTVTNANGESTLVMEDYITVHNCTGLAETNITSLQLMPNPAIDNLNILGITEEAQIKLLDLSGKVIIETNQTQIDLSNIPSGIYLVEVNDRDVTTLMKLIIQK
jgi:PKD repeat protein